MTESFARRAELPGAAFLKRHIDGGALTSFDIDMTARCNNDCKHCYINLPAGDEQARSRELSVEEINRIADEAVALGAMWCTLTGGEPLLRDDFADIYLSLKKKGLLISVFTNANLISEEHIRMFRQHPPRDVEVSVYGVTEQTYESVTRRSGSFAAFTRGVESLLASGIKVRFKAMAIRSNVHELPEIAKFCRERTKDYFRFDPWLHLRYDGSLLRNAEIESERLSPEEFIEAERGDSERYEALTTKCKEWLLPSSDGQDMSAHLFTCEAGVNACSISWEGIYRLCSSLCHPDCTCDLRKVSLMEAYCHLAPKVRTMQSSSGEYLSKCRRCNIINFCMWCPAHAYLETGKLDGLVDYFCQVARARAQMLELDSNLADM